MARILARLKTKLIVKLIDNFDDFPIGIEETQEIRLKMIEGKAFMHLTLSVASSI